MNLFDSEAVARCGSPEILRHRALLAFGLSPQSPGNPLSSIPAEWPTELRETWNNCIAAEILLAVRSGSAWHIKLSPGSRPCGMDSPRLRDLQGIPFGVALFPIASNTGNPELGRVWCFSLADTRKRLAQPIIRLDGWTPFLNSFDQPERLRFYFDLPQAAPITGRSWQLAAHLAAIFSAPERGAQARELAANWIVTGAVYAGRAVLPVDCGNKCRLESGDRRWLYPAKSVGFEGVAGHAVTRLTETRAHILNTPIPLPEETWPARIRVLHMLAGGRTEAQEAAGLIPDKVDRIVLWHSTNQEMSVVPAGKLAAAFDALRPRPKVERNLLSANDLVAMQEAIAARLLPDLKKATERDPVYFNVTSGNRLMFFAVAMLAQHPDQYGKLRLIYRERDTPAFSYIQLRYTAAGPETRSLVLPPDFPAVKRQQVENLLATPEKLKPVCFTNQNSQEKPLIP